MKKELLLLLCLMAGTICEAQILKKLGTQVKDDIEWRARRKAGQKIDQGIDSLIAAPKKIADKKASKETTINPPEQQNKNNNATTKKNNQASGVTMAVRKFS